MRQTNSYILELWLRTRFICVVNNKAVLKVVFWKTHYLDFSRTVETATGVEEVEKTANPWKKYTQFITNYLKCSITVYLLYCISYIPNFEVDCGNSTTSLRWNIRNKKL